MVAQTILVFARRRSGNLHLAWGGSIISQLCEHPVNEGRKFCLLSRAGLRECLLKLAACSRNCNTHRLGGSLQAMPVGHGYCGLRLAIGQVESSSERFD